MNLQVYCHVGERLDYVEVPLKEDAYSFTLECLPGASGILLQARLENRVLDIELSVGANDPVDIRLVPGPNGLRPDVGVDWYLLPVRNRTPTFQRPLRPGETEDLDILLLIDGTTTLLPVASDTNGGAGSSLVQSGSESEVEPRLRSLFGTQEWAEASDRLVNVVEQLGNHYKNTRVAVLAFGDAPLDDVRAGDLDASYQLRPPQAVFGPRTRLRRLLEEVSGTSGGDVVDALAEALEHVKRCNWRNNARRIVLIYGDSPGSALLEAWDPRRGLEGEALPASANRGLRRFDVYEQAGALFRGPRAVEIVTIYRDLGEHLWFDRPERKAIRTYTRRQYTRLASWEEAAFRDPVLDPARVADALLDPPRLLGRGVTWGRWVGPSPHSPAEEG